MIKSRYAVITYVAVSGVVGPKNYASLTVFKLGNVASILCEIKDSLAFVINLSVPPMNFLLRLRT
jgi:hypothetical protein